MQDTRMATAAERFSYGIGSGRFNDAAEAAITRGGLIECFGLLTENDAFMCAVSTENTAQIGLMLSQARNEWIEIGMREAAEAAEEADDLYRQSRGTL